MKNIFLFICCFACSVGFSQEDVTSKIDAVLSKFNSENTPGLSIRVVKQEAILYSKSFGLSNLDYNTKNSDSTAYSIASVSKQFTASAIWSLIQENKLSLEDDVSLYLKEFPKYKQPIKIKHLLNHTSGIRNYHTLMFLSGFDYDKTYYDNDTVYKLACQQKGLNNSPGELVAYSNTNYNLLALIVEQVSGENLNDYLKSQLLEPLGMNATFVRISTGGIIKNKAIGYQKKGDTYVYSVSNQLSYGAGSMGSNLKDMTVWLQLLNGDLPKYKKLSQFLQEQEFLTDGNLANYARGIMVDIYKGYKTLSHSGYGFGGQTQVLTIPELHIGVVIFTNLQSINPTPISYKILDILLPESSVVKDVAKKKAIFEKQDLSVLIGDYKEINSDMKMIISVENDTLKAKSSLGRNVIPLKASSKNKFSRVNNQSVKYDFTVTPKHDLTISFGGTPFYFKRANFIKDEAVAISDFIGDFYSEELGVTYSFSVKENRLILSYKGNENMKLFSVQRNEFGNNNRTLYHFEKDEKQKVFKMILACDGTVSNIEFVKVF